MNPNNRMYVSNEEMLRLGEIMEYTTWYNGNSSELLEFYTESMNTYFPSNSIYLRNRMQYFWARSVNAKKAFRRTHDNLFADIIDVLTNIVGTPTIVGKEKELAKELEKSTGLFHIVNQKQIPLTLAQGTGCFKISSSPYESTPSLDYYTADRVRYHARGEHITGIDFIDYLKDDKGLKYMLVEKRYLTRSGENGGGDLHIDFHLYRWVNWQDSGNTEVGLDTLEETKGLKPTTVTKGLGKLFAVPTTILMDKRGGLYGRSIGEGKLDLLDMVDEAWSIEGRAVRLSTPQTYIPESLLRTTEVPVTDGYGNYETKIERVEPDEFDRDFVVTNDDVIPNGDGRLQSGGIMVDQPHMDVDQYDKTRRRAIIEILNGIMSVATLGVTLNPGMNEPLESREREKITTLTRNIIVAKEKTILENVLTNLMDMADYKRNGYFFLRAENDKTRVEVKFSEFANPSLETELKVLGSAWSSGQISTELYVENLWKDRLTDEEKQAEKERLEQARHEALLAPAVYEGNNVENIEEVLRNGIGDSVANGGGKQEGVSKKGKNDGGGDVGDDIRHKDKQ
jgi:hypothetical protein